MKSYKCKVRYTIESECLVHTDAPSPSEAYIKKLAVETIKDYYDIDCECIESTGGNIHTDVTIEEVKK